MTDRQPIFNVPGIVVAVLCVFLTVHLLRYVLPEEQSSGLIAFLAFIPARLSGAAQDLPGGDIAIWTQFVTHIFVHGDLSHLAINSAWLLAFGSSVARRIGNVRFLAFFVLCGVAGALFYWAVSQNALSLMVGASGAISGLMGAACRFLLPVMAGGDLQSLSGERPPPLLSLRETFSDRRILLAVAGWTVLNVVFAWGAAGLTDGANIAWEAHLGGFYMGLLTFGLFDPPPPVEHDVAIAE